MKTLELTPDQIKMLANGLQAMIERNNEIANRVTHLPEELKNAIRAESMKCVTMLNYLLTE